MNYGIFKNGRFLEQEQKQSKPRASSPNEKRRSPIRRLGCATLLLPILVLVLYFIIKSRV